MCVCACLMLLQMTYDYHGAWENVTGVNTPLYDEVAGDNLSINATLATYLAMDGVPASKLVLGYTTYRSCATHTHTHTPVAALTLSANHALAPDSQHMVAHGMCRARPVLTKVCLRQRSVSYNVLFPHH